MKVLADCARIGPKFKPAIRNAVHLARPSLYLLKTATNPAFILGRKRIARYANLITSKQEIEHEA
jgi:hypothetical protein